MKMIKLSEEHYIVVDDSEIKIGDIVAEKLLTGKYELFQIHTLNDIDKLSQRKIACSTQPESLGVGWMQSVQPLLLSEVKELLGIVDVEKKALEYNRKKFVSEFNPQKDQFAAGIIIGWKQALEDNKEKKYTEEDLMKAILMARKGYDEFGENGFIRHGFDYTQKDVIQSLQPKTEWEVEMIDGKLKLKQ